MNQLDLPLHLCHPHMRPFYTLDSYPFWRSIRFGYAMRDHRTPGSRATSFRDSDKDPIKQAISKMGECIAVRHDLVHTDKLNWKIGRPDNGLDYIDNDGVKTGVKTAFHEGRYMFYSPKQWTDYDRADFQRLVLVLYFVKDFSTLNTLPPPHERQFQIWGHISKERFKRLAKIAGSSWATVEPGTRYIERNELDLIDRPFT